MQRKIDAFLAKTPTALSSLLLQDQVAISGDSHQHLDDDDDDVEDDVCDDVDAEDDITGDDDDTEDHMKSTPTTNHTPESIALPLPSHLGINKHQDPIMAALSADELIIWQSQAADSLQNLRLSLGMKCGIFRMMKSNPRSQRTKTRAWKAVDAATATVQQHARSYCLAQAAMVRLNADPSILTKFPLLQKQDLTVSRDIVEENRLGQRSEHLSWVWRLDIGKAQDKDAWMDESEYYCGLCLLNTVTVRSVTRVNWLRAKAHSKRWEEEVLILKHEMVWTQLWFGHQKKMWEERQQAAKAASRVGHHAYAAKQARIWSQFLEHAKREFGCTDDTV